MSSYEVPCVSLVVPGVHHLMGPFSGYPDVSLCVEILVNCTLIPPPDSLYPFIFSCRIFYLVRRDRSVRQEKPPLPVALRPHQGEKEGMCALIVCVTVHTSMRGNALWHMLGNWILFCDQQQDTEGI